MTGEPLVPMLPLAVPAFLANGRDLEVIGFIIGVIFWVQMIRICATREVPSTAKILWLIFMIAFPGIGSLLYFFIRFPHQRELR